MKRIVKVKLYPTGEEKQKLRQLQLRCSYLYNRVNYILRQQYFSFGNVKVSNGTLYRLAKDLPEYEALPSDIAQEVLKKLSEDWKSFLNLKKLEKKEKLPPNIKKVSPPKYKKDRKKKQTLPMNIYIKTDRSYRLGNYEFELTVPKDINGKRLKVKAKYSIYYENIRNFGRAEVFCKAGEWWCYVTVNLQQEEKQPLGKRLAGIDFGIRNFLTLAVETDKGIEVFQFKSRELIKDYKRWDRKIATYQSILNRSGTKTSKKLQRLYIKRDKKLKQSINSMLNKVIDICVSRGVEKIYIGDLTGIRKDKDFGKLNVLLHNFWIRNYTLKRLKEKLSEAGIGIKPIPEHYTSSRCFKCGNHIKRPHQHYVVCENCGKLNADLNGAINILKRGKKNLSLEIVSFYQFKWIRGRVNSWIPIVMGEGDKPPCSLFLRLQNPSHFNEG
ncbi:RNA-guided endonuclease TnpB family protein [Desulfurobacterium sp. TC5-1]|uniref:RNA-guided endonuclease InsQ/TnpB family protein n=1 Tax=Desulfurobacterium sp. TC5-1 TaxID=1158318 RepID=UPI0009DB7765|nr:RNA-guided endonuclease TnpB family protein [Desulfurobacterium sp. TC5-1]